MNESVHALGEGREAPVPVRPPPLPLPVVALRPRSWCVTARAAVATLATARGTLSERCPIVADVLNFSALTGARSGTADDPLTTKEREG
jgi:hypothetical protein